MPAEADMDENENRSGCDDKNESIRRSVPKDHKVMVFSSGIDLDRHEACLVHSSTSWLVSKPNAADARKLQSTGTKS